jgi:hypothetical protein
MTSPQLRTAARGSSPCSAYVPMGRRGRRLHRALLVTSAVGVAMSFFAVASAPAATIFQGYYGLKEAIARPIGGSGTGQVRVIGSLAVAQSTSDLYATNLVTEEIEASAPERERLPGITGAGTPAGSFAFTSPSSITVDETGGPTNGDLFIADGGHGVVDIITTTGEYIGQLTGANTPAGSFSEPAGIAFDGSGNLYVADRGHGVIDKFAVGLTPVSDGDYLSQFSAPQITSLGSIAIDPGDNLYVSNYHENFVKFGPAGEYLGLIGPAGDTSEVRIDPVHGFAIFAVAARVFVTEYSGEPVWPATIPSEPQVLHIKPEEYPGATIDGVAEEYANALLYAGGTSFYFEEGSINPSIAIFHVPTVSTGPISNLSGNEVNVSGTINPAEGGPTRCVFEVFHEFNFYGEPAGPIQVNCSPKGPYTANTDQEVTARVEGLKADSKYLVRISASNEKGTNASEVLEFHTPIAVHNLVTGPASAITDTSATLNGSFEGNGEDTHYYFQWGKSSPHESNSAPHYGSATPLPPGADAGSGTGVIPVSVELTGLEPATTYHYRIVASNPIGKVIAGDHEFTTPPSAPTVEILARSVHSDSAQLLARVNPRGAETSYNVEYGEANCATSSCDSLAAGDAGSGNEVKEVTVELRSLTPTTTYHFRIVAENVVGEANTSDQTFTTLPRLDLTSDTCPNAQVRQQTGAAQLLDCRAYELVSAGSAGGYDVTSDLAPNQTPYEGFPLATSPPRVLYSVHNGAIPGTGMPTNFSQDPYIATRTAEGWATEYVGFPASGLVANEKPFGSPLSEADSSLNSFAFGGESLCSPCFPDGSTGIPLRLPDGSVVQGMAGSLDPGPSAAPAGEVRKHFSADGSHFVFGSAAQFEPDGNSNGDVSIYDRNLSAGVTNVVSKTPNGATMTGPGIAELDISSDGSRIVIGRRVGTDAAGNSLYHLYMNVGDAGRTVDLTPGASSGALYDGMSADGTKVYFTSRDKLTSDDHDTSADVYRADVTSSDATVTRVSTGAAAGDTDSCSAASGWNGGKCDALAVAGGAGVAAGDGSIYFLSPELLSASGVSQPVAGAPNLYLARPGSVPVFVATLSVGDPVVENALSAAAVHRWGSFQVAPSGDFAAFVSRKALTGFHNDGFSEVFRYAAKDARLDCVSCAPTNVIPTSDATLPAQGSGLTDDGRVFFSSGEALSPGDTNGSNLDAYEWETGTIDLVSTGLSPFDSEIFSVSADGTDALFFTRETLVGTDRNGDLMKIYDARHLGGFLLNPPPVPCQASDECHGPSSVVPAPPEIGTYEGQGGNVVPEGKVKKCRHGKMLRHGRCVSRHHHHPRSKDKGGRGRG